VDVRASVTHEHIVDAGAQAPAAQRHAFEDSRTPVRRPQLRARPFALKDVINRIAERQGSEGLSALAFELALKLAEAVERVATDEGLSAIDLVDLWFAD
jgi:hypothetical protein